jgi:hypothetical protein
MNTILQKRVNEEEKEKKQCCTQYQLVQELVQEQGWLEWQRLLDCVRGTNIPTLSGLYRVRCVLSLEQSTYAQVLYIGQSSNLRVRVGMFADVFQTDMPYRTPHVAGPGLWSLLHRARLEQREIALHVSVFPLGEAISKSLRLGYEALAIGLHRQHFSRSPVFNYSRMLRGYVSSSYNTGPEKSYRGMPSPLRDKTHLPSLIPSAPIVPVDIPTSQNWCGHKWSEWVDVRSATPPKDGIGLYRIRSQCEATLLYVGSGKLRERLKSYRRQTTQATLECSWAFKPLCMQGYQEYVDDAIAAHMLSASLPPARQFERGEREVL